MTNPVAAAPDLYAALEAVEWIERDPDFHGICPSCHNSANRGHEPDCQIRLALKKAREDAE